MAQLIHPFYKLLVIHSILSSRSVTKIILKYVKEYSQKFPEVKCGEVWGGDGSFVSIKKFHQATEIMKF